MIIAHDLQAIFIHVHRTGGTSISNLFWQKGGVNVEEVAAHGNYRSREKDVLFRYPDYFTFGFVRNPWARLLSWYALTQKVGDRPVDEKSDHFEKYLEALLVKGVGLDEYFHANQLDFFSNEEGEVMVDRIGRFEYYEEDLRSILKDIGWTVDELPKVNETQARDYTRFYTPKGIQLVEKYCIKDIEYFGYRF